MSKNKNDNAAVYGAGASAATFGAGMVDLRKKSKIPKRSLGKSWADVDFKLKAGDVIVGAHKGATETAKADYKTFKELYKANRSKGRGRIKSSVRSMKGIDKASLISKFSDPTNSHAALVTTPHGDVSYGGGSTKKITELELPKDVEDFKRLSKKGQTPHYTVYRPKKGVSDMPGLIDRMATYPARDYVASKAGGPKDYNTTQGVKAQIKDWVLPKLRRNESLKSKALRKKELCTIGGTCGTTGAQFSKTTVGGKSAKDVLPSDYTRSSSYKAVGTIGKDTTTKFQRKLFKIPKYLTKGVAAAAVGGLVYGTVKGYKKFKNRNFDKITKTAGDIYKESFNDELEKLGFRLPWQKKKSKIEEWKDDLSSSIKSKAEEYNLESKFKKMLARIMMRRGL